MTRMKRCRLPAGRGHASGALYPVGTPFEVYSRPADEATALFLGDALVLPAELHGGRAQCAIGALLTDNDDATGQGRVMLRPEQLMITPCQNEESAVTILDVDFPAICRP